MFLLPGIIYMLLIAYAAFWDFFHAKNQHGGLVESCYLEFSKNWPPIDDDEFLKRCTPGTRRETALKVRRMVAEVSGIPYENIYPEQRLVEDLFFE